MSGEALFLKSSPLQPFECVTTINIVTIGYPTMNAADLSSRTIFIPDLLIKPFSPMQVTATYRNPLSGDNQYHC